MGALGEQVIRQAPSFQRRGPAAARHPETMPMGSGPAPLSGALALDEGRERGEPARRSRQRGKRREERGQNVILQPKEDAAQR